MKNANEKDLNNNFRENDIVEIVQEQNLFPANQVRTVKRNFMAIGVSAVVMCLFFAGVWMFSGIRNSDDAPSEESDVPEQSVAFTDEQDGAESNATARVPMVEDLAITIVQQSESGDGTVARTNNGRVAVTAPVHVDGGVLPDLGDETASVSTEGETPVKTSAPTNVTAPSTETSYLRVYSENANYISDYISIGFNENDPTLLEFRAPESGYGELFRWQGEKRDSYVQAVIFEKLKIVGDGITYNGRVLSIDADDERIMFARAGSIVKGDYLTSILVIDWVNPGEAFSTLAVNGEGTLNITGLFSVFVVHEGWEELIEIPLDITISNVTELSDQWVVVNKPGSAPVAPKGIKVSSYQDEYISIGVNADNPNILEFRAPAGGLKSADINGWGIINLKITGSDGISVEGIRLRASEEYLLVFSEAGSDINRGNYQFAFAFEEDIPPGGVIATLPLNITGKGTLNIYGESNFIIKGFRYEYPLYITLYSVFEN